MAQLAINGNALEYGEIGSGESVVLVHGSASDHRTWHSQQAAFAERFRLIWFSRRYHWPNDPIPDGADYSMDEQVADLGALVRSLDAAPAHLVGHSYGAFLCLLLAIRQPSLVRTLVLAEPPVITLFVSSIPKPLEILRLLATRPRTAAAIIKFGATGLAPARKAFQRGDPEAGIRVFGDAVFGPGGYDRLSEPRKAQAHDNLSNVKAEILGSGLAPLADREVRGVDAPALLVTGERSVRLFQCLTDRLAELLPDAERIEIPAASHVMHADNAPAYNQAVLSFLEEHAGEPRTQ
jgi:pimeloyl-ACP methyl ester carboxylesterase